jgi:hypothetical protein
VPILALRDFEDFFEGEMRFNVLIGRDGSASGGEVVATFHSAQTMADDLRAYMIESPPSVRSRQDAFGHATDLPVGSFCNTHVKPPR